MKLILVVSLALHLLACREVSGEITDEQLELLLDELAKLNETVVTLKSVQALLARQTMLQQLYIEESTRSGGDSGIKTIRLHSTGARPYHSDHFSYTNKAASLHSHDNHIRTIGSGETIVVLNGVEFRSRHNDYPLEQPSTTVKDYNAVETIPYPDVPESVLQKTTVAEQVAEMQEYFRAFKLQDTSIRNYTQYFKPVLCYIEGAWTTNTEDLDDPFESDRHFIDASSWHDLQEKIRFTSYTGAKDTAENYAYLPTMILNVTEDGIPIMAQWNYRVLCHQVTHDIPLNRLRAVDDLTTRMSVGFNTYQWADQNSARFQLNPEDQDEWIAKNKYEYVQYIDKLMQQIPGKDNYPAVIQNSIFNLTAYEYGTDFTEVLNVGYYHRIYEVQEKDAMGISLRRRGFHDANVFMAENTREEIAPMSLHWCEKIANEDGQKVETCYTFDTKFSYAIPFEIIYLTPIHNWNPYGITYWGEFNSEEAKAVTKDGRNGNSEETAFNGTHSKHYYLTPIEFYSDISSGGDPADTSGSKWILDPNGDAHQCFSSGVRVTFKPIGDVGTVRQRYPIFPVHEEGNTIYKNVEALADLVMEPHNHTHMFRGHYNRDRPDDTYFTLRMASSSPKPTRNGGTHEHLIYLTKEDLDTMFINKQEVTKVTTFNFGPADTYETGHRHTLRIEGFLSYRQMNFRYNQCDDVEENMQCDDGHHRKLIIDNFQEVDRWQSDASKWPDNVSATE